MKKKLSEAPLYYWEESSYMMAIPVEFSEDILKTRLEKLSHNKEFKVTEVNGNIGGFKVNILYDDEEYEVGFYPGDINVPAYYLHQNFLFTEQERTNLLNAKKAITIFMKFASNPKKSYHLQLKIVTALVPDLLGLLDESAEKMLPAKWVKMAAESKVLPSARDLFNVQAVQGKKNKVWLHTHGLCRCGLTELEILESDQEHYQQHYNLISTYAMYLIDNDERENPPSHGAYIGCLVNGEPVVVTHKSWVEGILEYKKLKLGNIEDRQGGHNSKTSLIFLYLSEEDEKADVLSKVTVYNDLWGENPLFFFSDEETLRMKSLARERFNYVVENYRNKDNAVLIKIGLPLKEKGKYEHIWFELLEIKGEKFKAKLTQEPYEIENMHTGDEGWYTLDDVTDWLIYTKMFVVSPSNAYLLSGME